MKAPADLCCPRCGENDASQLLVAVPGKAGLTCATCRYVYMPGAMEDSPQCHGLGWLVPGATCAHWAGLVPWEDSLTAMDCERCHGTGRVSRDDTTEPDAPS